MAKKFMFCLSLSRGAWIMALSNLMLALCTIFAGSIELFYKHTDEATLYLIVSIIMGVFNLIAGVILVIGIMQGNEKYVLLYLMLEMMNLIIITIFALLNMFEYRYIFLIPLFIISLVFWYGLYCLTAFYTELAEYNSVKSGALEISCNPHINPVMGMPEKTIEITAV